MATRAAPFNDWLARGFAAVAARTGRGPPAGPTPRLCLVLGNEGGDMDSCVCALYGALLLQALHDAAAAPVQCVPVLNFAKDDLPLRGDVDALFRAHGVDQDALVHCPTHVDLSLPPADALPAGDVAADATLFLVDHNRLGAPQRCWDDRVVGVVDHHADEGHYPADADATRVALGTAVAPIRVVVTPVGSAATLLTQTWRAVAGEVPLPLPALLRSPIVMDTTNFTDKNKTTPLDIEQGGWLETQSGETRAALDAAFAGLKAAKYDTSRLTVPQQLRRDYKHFALPYGADGASTLSVGVAAWVEPRAVAFERHGAAGLAAEGGAYCRAHRPPLDALVIMFASETPDGATVRQVSFLGPEGGAATGPALALAEGFTSADGPTYRQAEGKAAPCDFTDRSVDAGVVSFEQADGTVSRKQFTPLLSKWVKLAFARPPAA